MDWEYSNYPEFMGIRNGSLRDKKFLSDNFGNDMAYQGWVENYVNSAQEIHEIKDYIFE